MLEMQRRWPRGWFETVTATNKPNGWVDATGKQCEAIPIEEHDDDDY